MKIQIEFTGDPHLLGWAGWKVTYGDKHADNLMYDEMIGLVASLTLPNNRPNIQWLKTTEEHEHENTTLG